MFDQSKIQLPPQAPPDAPPPKYIVEKQKEWAHLTEVEVRQILAGYYGMVALADGYCGMILDALEGLGIQDETMVIWTVDHGDQMGEHKMFLKFCMYEGSVHIPLLIHIPGKKSGVRSELVEHIDLFPTICELVGAECPGTVQGRSLVSLLGETRAPEDWRDAVFSQIGDVEMIRTKEWKLNVCAGRPGELYDLKNDPHEFYNLVKDSQYEKTVEALLARLKEWRALNSPGGVTERAAE